MTTQININSKSQLAKLIATENLIVEHNNVKTASFDTVNRILTLPIFKVQSGDVYDMLIAHECSHALFTPAEGWKSIMDDDELRMYVNVLEDTRIDKLIQKKYPGVVINYMNGYEILDKQNFFGLKNKDVNNDLMLIDKINMRSKSLNRIKFNFSKEDKEWLKVVDDIKTFDDVVTVAKLMLDWQKKQVEQLKKLPNFDDLEIVKQYGLDDKKDQSNEETTNSNNENKNDSSSNGDNNKEEKLEDQKNVETGVVHKGQQGGGGKLTAITNMTYEANKNALYDSNKSYSYYNMPDPILKNIIISQKEFRNDFKKYIIKEFAKGHFKEQYRRYYNFLKTDFKQFKSDSKKTVMYLVKEFEMKKAATSYKRSTQDKTGILDPLKLKNYKFSDDIFKRLTILPDSKNHGMMMLLDWSGSMSDVIKQTVDQLCNLIWFCQKINIPFNVYFFTSEVDYYSQPNSKHDEKLKPAFKYKVGDIALDNFKLVEIANHNMKKSELDESLMYMYSMGLDYMQKYTRYSFDSHDNPNNYNFGCPSMYSLGSTPLNESLIVFSKLIPMFKQKYRVEKMTFITLTDGASNGNRGIFNTDKQGQLSLISMRSGTPVLRSGKKYISQKKLDYWNFWGSDITANFLDLIRKQNVTTLGFYILKKTRGYDAERFFRSDDKTAEFRKKQWTKDKCTTAVQPGYNEFYLINGKNMNIENADLSDVSSDMKSGKIKQIFSKSMKGRITSRLLLNKFISKVA